jgi:hypothetical protein
MPHSAHEADRTELHNSSVDTVVAEVGACGQTHLATGRVCTLPARHAGSCDFTPREVVDRALDESEGLPLH